MVYKLPLQVTLLVFNQGMVLWTVENVVNIRVTLDGDSNSVGVIVDVSDEAVEGLCVVLFAVVEMLVALVTKSDEFLMVEAVEVRQLHEQGHVSLQPSDNVMISNVHLTVNCQSITLLDFG